MRGPCKVGYVHARCRHIHAARPAMWHNTTGIGLAGGSASLRIITSVASAPALSPSAGSASNAAQVPTGGGATAATAPTQERAPNPSLSVAPSAAPAAIAPVTPAIETAQLPGFAQAAMEALREAAFDEDAKLGAATLLKLLDNVIARGHQAKVRSLKLANETLYWRVLRWGPAVAVLLAAGFACVNDTGALQPMPCHDYASAIASGAAIARRDTGCVALRMPCEAHSPGRVAALRAPVAACLQALGAVPPDEPAHGPLATSDVAESPTPSSGMSPAPFNIYAPTKISMNTDAPSIPDDGTRSITETRLAKLRERFDGLIAASPYNATNPPARQLRVLRFPGVTSDSSNPARFSAAELASVASEQLESDASSPVEAGAAAAAAAAAAEPAQPGSTDTAEDLRIIMEAAKRRRAAMEKQQQFQTRAIRELDALRTKKVYHTSIIRVLCPDRTLLQGVFSPREPLAAVCGWLCSLISTPNLSSSDLTVFQTPPRVELDCAATLEQLGLQPAACVHVSWELGPDRESVMWHDAVVEAAHAAAEASAEAAPSAFGASEPVAARAERAASKRAAVLAAFESRLKGKR